MLDPKSRRDLLSTLRRLAAATHLTILSITHDMDEAAASNRILVMQDGKIVNDGTPGQIFSTEKALGAPFSERLRRILLAKGRRAPDQYMTEEEMVDWLWK
jgi:energy-coupling factor transport system ATP-binding protein